MMTSTTVITEVIYSRYGSLTDIIVSYVGRWQGVPIPHPTGAGR